MSVIYRDYPRDFSRVFGTPQVWRRSRNREISFSHQNRSPFFLVRGFCGGSNFGRVRTFDPQSDPTSMIQFKTKSGNNDLSKISLSQIISISGLKLHAINCSSDRIRGPYILHKLPLDHILLPLNDVHCS